MSTTAQKVAWIVAGIGLLLLIVSMAAVLPFWLDQPLLAGSYLLPLALSYLVLSASDKRTSYVGIIASLILLAFVWVVALIFSGINALTPTGAEPPLIPSGGPVSVVFLMLGWPSILLLLVSIYSIVRKK